MILNDNKNTIRREVITRRDALGATKRSVLSEIIGEKIYVLDEFKSAKVVLSYANLGSEVITDKINQRAIADGKELYLPKTYTDREVMDFYRVNDMNDLQPGVWGIREPVDTTSERLDLNRFEPTEIFAIIPCVAFDSERNRLGYGGGYYDRFLIDHDGRVGTTAVVAFGLQEVEAVPVASHDVKPMLIVTE
ncbi:MAG: 5-formyltetrahydrofolate cyclo-ligase [Eubacterium sp.]|nr:5-formyltetrahydrofolate cyclo-ligase [Eubacterium sp.]